MSNINCTEFKGLLEQAVESRQSLDTSVLREHVAMCSECRCAWVAALLIDRAAAEWKKAIASVDLSDSVLYQLATERDEDASRVTLTSEIATDFVTSTEPPIAASGRRFSRSPKWLRRRSMVAAFGVLAGTVCVAITIGRVGGPRQSAKPGAIEVAEQSHTSARKLVVPAQTDKSQAANQAPVESLVRDAGSAYLNLAGGAAKAVAAAAVLVPPADSPAAPDSQVKEKDRWVDEVGREFEPVRRHLSQAFGFLIQAVPTEKAPAT